MSKKYPCPAGREPDCGYPACAHDHQCELAASTCSLCGGMGELEGYAGVPRMPCHRCKQFENERKQFENEQCEELWDAIRAYRDAKGRFQTQKACEHLLSLLPENQPEPPTENEQ